MKIFYQKDVVDDHGRDREDNDNEKVGGMMKLFGYANDKRARFISSKGVSTTTSWPHHDTLVSFFLSNKDWLYSTPCRQERRRCLTSSHPTTLFSLYPLGTLPPYGVPWMILKTCCWKKFSFHLYLPATSHSVSDIEFLSPRFICKLHCSSCRYEPPVLWYAGKRLLHCYLISEEQTCCNVRPIFTT